MHEPLSDHWD
jgi:trans-aconitate methyltransferase